MFRRVYKELISWLAFSLILVSVAPIYGQRRAAGKQATTSAPSAARAGWSGVVTFRKTLSESMNTGKVPVMGRIDKERNYSITQRSREYRYVARAIVGGSGPETDAKAKVEFSDEDREVGKMVIVDSCHAFNDVHEFIDNSTSEKITKASAAAAINTFNLYVDTGGRYSLSLRFPDAKGTYKDASSLTRSGYCQAKNNEPKSSSHQSETTQRGESISVTGQVDPNNPDVIEGSQSSSEKDSFSYTITWRFTRKPQKLLITDLRFEHPEYPNPDKWVEVIEQRGTIDGNRVKVKAKVVNLSDEAKFVEVFFKETYKGDHWNGAMPDRPLNDNTVSIRLEPGEEREVEVLWNSSGYAWFDDGRPRLVQRIKAEAWENFKKQDEMTKNLKVAPKPLILVTGLWSDANTFSAHQNYLTTTHSYDWKAIIFNDNITGNGAKPNGYPRNIFDYADALEQKVRKTQQELNAWHVDMAGHSTGGLIARVLVHKFGNTGAYDDPRVKHLMLIGTPNTGIACTDGLNREFNEPEKIFSAKELFLEEMRRFNQFVTERHGTKFSALVGKSSSMLCAPLITGDGVVEVESASAGVEDIIYSTDKHAELANGRSFGEYIRPRVITGPRGTYPLRK